MFYRPHFFDNIACTVEKEGTTSPTIRIQPYLYAFLPQGLLFCTFSWRFCLYSYQRNSAGGSGRNTSKHSCSSCTGHMPFPQVKGIFPNPSHRIRSHNIVPHRPMSNHFFLHFFQSIGQNNLILRGSGYPLKVIPHHNINSARKYHCLWKPSVHTKFSCIFCFEITLILGLCPFPMWTFFQLRRLICGRLLCLLRDQGRIPAGIYTSIKATMFTADRLSLLPVSTI